jgi:outer membrane protein assembly factor BamB
MSIPPATRRQLLRAGGAGLLGAVAGTNTTSATASEGVLWQRELDAGVATSPTVVDGTLFVGGPGRSLLALGTESGEQQWSVTPGPVLGEPTVVEGRVYAIGGNVVAAVDADTGDSLWRTEVAGGGGRSVTVVNGTVFVGGGKTITALSEADGGVLWRFDVDRTGTAGTPTVVDDTVLFGTTDGSLFGVSAPGGEQLWTEKVGGSFVLPPTEVDGTALFSVSRFDSDVVHAVDSASGELLWTGGFGTVPSAAPLVSTPTVADERLFVVLEEGVFALDTAGGEQLWAADPDEQLLSSTTVADGTVLVGGQTGVHALDAASGESLWTVETDEPVRSAPLVVDGTVFAGTLSERQADASPDLQSGSVYAIDSDIEGSSGDSRVLLGTLNHHGEWADQAPSAMFALNPPDPGVDEQVIFDAGATSGEIERYEWDFTDDGGTDATGETVTRAFGSPGRRQVTLTVTTTRGETRTATRRQTVSAGYRWAFGVGPSFSTTPTVVDGTAFLAASNAGVFAVDTETGTADWTFESDQPVSPPTVVDGSLFVAAGSSSPGETPGRVYALDAATGEQRWAVDVSGDPSWLTVVNETVFVSGTQDRVHALAAASGGTLWETAVDGSLRTAPTVAGDNLYVGSQEALFALGTLNGTEQWRFDGQFVAPPTVVDGVVFAGDGSARVHALEAATGEARWSVSFSNSPFLAAPTVADGTVLASGSSTLFALNRETGNTRWTADIDNGLNAAPTVADGTVYTGDARGRVVALDLATGERQWGVAPDENPDVPDGDTNGITGGLTVADGTLVFASRNGFVYGYDLGAGQYGDGSRARLGTLGNHGEWRYADQTIDIDASGTNDGDGGAGSGTDSGGGGAGSDIDDGDGSADSNTNNGDGGGGDDGDGGGGNDGFGPGLGPAAALAGLGGAGYLLRQRRDDGDTP